MDRAHTLEPEIHLQPAVLAHEQVTMALAALDRPASAYLHWPFPELDALAGPIAPGNVWFVVGASGGGKTTFVSSAIDLWRRAGKRIFVMPLETSGDSFRTYLACMAAGVPPGDALTGGLLHRSTERARVDVELRNQLLPPYVDQVYVSPQRSINLHGLLVGLREAKAFEADVVIVDHIDHISGGDGRNAYSESKLVNDTALTMAADFGAKLLFTSQLNMSAGKGDYLAKYKPPKDEHVAFGELKRRNATGMLGLYRPIRQPRAGETAGDFLDALRRATRGMANPYTVLEPNRMGVSAMKLRNFGAREGNKIVLGVEHGHVHSIREADRWTTGGYYPKQID